MFACRSEHHVLWNCRVFDKGKHVGEGSGQSGLTVTAYCLQMTQCRSTAAGQSAPYGPSELEGVFQALLCVHRSGADQRCCFSTASAVKAV